ncbi:hypothetical protein [Nostoc sp.]|uniref:hypothetical protein n=1 Tax=Nostoc sp. TaxID=1180 RepID=UPI002FFBA25D
MKRDCELKLHDVLAGERKHLCLCVIYVCLFTYSYFQVNRPCARGTAMFIGVNLMGNGRLETASTQTKATDPGFQTLNLT